MKPSVRIPFLSLCGLLLAASAQASPWSANIGYNSEYIYRGIPQKNSSAFAGVDYENNGFYAGAWGADVGDGIEIVYYGGYNWEGDEVTLGAGFTLYTYTGDFDDTYKEINLSAGWKWFTLDVAIGEYDNFDASTLDYSFYSLTAEHNGIYGKVGTFGDDFDGSYYEAGYGSTVSVNDMDLFDYAIAVIHSDATLLGGDSDTNLIFTLSKAFDF